MTVPDVTTVRIGSRRVEDAHRVSDAPDRADKRRFFTRPIFLISVVLSTMLATIYFGFLASDIFISESRFVVRSPARQSSSPLGIILNAGGFSGTSEEANAVREYVQSRNALDEADFDGFVTKAFSAVNVSWFDRFGGLVRGGSREQLYDYYLDKVSIETDSGGQVARLTVKAFRPEDAREINRRLLARSESLVNRLAGRAREDAIATARGEVTEASARARSAAVALSRFRGQKGMINPEREAESHLQMISKLQDELISARTQLQQLQSFTPQASQIPFTRDRIRSLEREIAEQTGSIAGGRASLSAVAVKFQELELNNTLYAKQLEAALGALEEARAEARRKRAYIERISEPSLPDYPGEPRRIRGILATLVLGILVWAVLNMLVAGIREHRD